MCFVEVRISKGDRGDRICVFDQVESGFETPLTGDSGQAEREKSGSLAALGMTLGSEQKLRT